MTYATVATMRGDYNLSQRVSACVAIEGIASFPEQWAADHSWVLAAQPGWAEAWESSLAGHADDPSYAPGRDEAVITDGMILSAVQSLAASEGLTSGVVD